MQLEGGPWERAAGMNGEQRARAGAKGGAATELALAVDPRGELAMLLLRDAAVSEAQLQHAERVRAKLGVPRPLVLLLVDLGLVSAQRLRDTLHAHRLGLRIGALLVELGHLCEADLETALHLQQEAGESGGKLGEILVEYGLLGAEQLAQVLSSQLGIPCVDAGHLEPDPALLARVPLGACRRHRFLPLCTEGGRVCVAFADPLDKEDAAAAQAIFGAELAPWITSSSALEQTLARLELTARVVSNSETGQLTAAHTLREILDAAFRLSASEVHLEPGPRRLVVRMRRDGVLSTFRELPAALATPLVRRLELEAGVEEAEGAPHREGCFRAEHEARAFDLRVSFLGTVCGESVVLRIRDPQRPALPLDALGLLPSMRRRLEEEVLCAPGSVFLIAGPAGSGRTATLHACVAAVAGPHARVVLLEECLETRLDGVSQSVLPPATAPPLSERVLRALQQDPDVLALGVLQEAADLATAFRAARSGVRVLAVLEAQDAITALAETAAAVGMPGFGPHAFVAVLSQRLVRRVCMACARSVLPCGAELRALGCTAQDLAGRGFRRGRGCGRCDETGYDGRLGLFELLLLDEAGREHLRTFEGAAALRRSAALSGPATLLEDGLVKAACGLTTLEELVRVVPRAARPRPLAELERLLGEQR